MNEVSFAVEVADVHSTHHPSPAVAEASVRVGIATPQIASTTPLIRLNHILIQADSSLGGYRCLFPRYRLSNGKSQPTVLFDRALQRAIEDAVLAAFKNWHAEQAERAKQAQSNAAQQQIGGGQ
jgi:hypothetical protein